MSTNRVHLPFVARLSNIAFLVFVLLLMVGPFAPTVPLTPPQPQHSSSTVHVQPELLQQVALAERQHTNINVYVIVQKAITDAHNQASETLIRQLGGHITLDLRIINGFAAVLPARVQTIVTLGSSALVKWVSLDAPIEQTQCSNCIDTKNLANTYIRAIGADKVWNELPYLQGQGIGVAVVDSGVNPQQDLYTIMGQNRLVAAVAFNTGWNKSTSDAFGHGMHVAGIIGGNGSRSSGVYTGVAPFANIISVKVSDDVGDPANNRADAGSGKASSVVAGLQWILDNKNAYNIRVVNISINNSVAESYHTNPICAAAEILWFNGIVVVASAGNAGSGAIYPPANDPFVITVGATDDRGTPAINDDQVATFSASGVTSDSFAKPDLVAPGKNIISLSPASNSVLAIAHPDARVQYAGAEYFRMSGTSVSAPMVAGAAALILQKEPKLTPDQVKFRLLATANKNWPGYVQNRAGSGYLDVYAATRSGTTQSANTGLPISKLLTTGSKPVNTSTWASVNWASVNWASVNWASVNWASVNWASDYWGK